MVQNLALVEEVAKVAQELGVLPGQLALAWLLAKRPDCIPIPGTKRIKYLEDNVAAVHIKLSDELMHRLEAAVPKGGVSHPWLCLQRSRRFMMHFAACSKVSVLRNDKLVPLGVRGHCTYCT